MHPVRGEVCAQGDVLGVAQLGCGQRPAPELRHRGDPRAHHQPGSAVGGAGDDADQAASALHERVDGRVGTDEGGVQGPTEDRGHGVGPRVERLRLQVHAAPQRAGEHVAVDPDDGRRVGEVGEVAEADGHAGGRSPGGRRLAAACEQSRGCAEQGDRAREVAS